MAPDLGPADRQALVQLARASLHAAVAGAGAALPPVGVALAAPRGAFVTLRCRGALRGCVGYPIADRPLAEVVRDAVTAAACEDPRFPPVTPAELSVIDLEVSVLAPPRRLWPVDPAAVAIGRHALLVRLGDATGFLLPQVAVERALDGTAFLAAACRKAGLCADAWRRPEADVHLFDAEILSE